MEYSSVLLSCILLLIAAATETLAQSSPAPAPATKTVTAPAPAPPGPTNVTKILEKGGQFTTLIRLLKSTGVSEQLYGQLNNSADGMTILAPSDNAFSSLTSGSLNSLTDEQQTELVQFHIIPNFISDTNFQTVSNPVRTQAGDSADGHFPLNITTSGNTVNITTGLTNASVSGKVYSDGQLAVYQVDQVLRPQQVFDPQPPAPAPSPVVLNSKKGHADSPDNAASSAVRVVGCALNAASFGVMMMSSALAWFYYFS